MKTLTQKSSLLLVLLLFTFGGGLTSLHAQSVNPNCQPCSGPWSANITSSFTFSLPGHPGCLYKAYVVYKTRPCMGKTEYEIVSHVFEDLNPIGSGCDLHCADTYELNKVLHNHVLNLITGGLGTVIKITPSPCYYAGTITVPPGAEACFGMTPGTTRTVLLPCDNNGCCYTELTPVGSSYNQHVIFSTPCPDQPVIPPTTNIEWSCDLIGGGTMSFTVAFTPDVPLTCTMLCNSGLAKRATGINEAGVGDIAAFNLHPNPVSDFAEISFHAAKANEAVTIEIIDISGRLVLSKKENTTGGAQTIRLNTSLLPAGAYLCRFTSGSESITTKLTK